MFTRGHYEAVAEILRRRRRGLYKGGPHELLDELISEFAALFEGDNEAFSRKRFLEASGFKYDPSPVLKRLEQLENMAKVAIDRE
jgi:hypothetical protein